MRYQVNILCGVLSACYISSVNAANTTTIWGQPHQYSLLNHFNINNISLYPDESQLTSTDFLLKQSRKLPSNNSLRLLHVKRDSNGKAHARYQQIFQGIPVDGYQLIFSAEKNRATGVLITEIESNIRSTKPKLIRNKLTMRLLNHIRKTFPESSYVSTNNTELIIHITNNKNLVTAYLAYKINLTLKSNHRISRYVYVLDANSGALLSYWNNSKHESIGQGVGGNDKNPAELPDGRAAEFQYGNSHGGSLEELGLLDLTRSGSVCTTENNGVRVINMSNIDYDSIAAPITVSQEAGYPAFSYTCTAFNDYANNNDGTSCSGACSPVNGGHSPINDTLYFASNTMSMLQNKYRISSPVGTDTPVRLYTHLANEANAEAIYTQRNSANQIISHSQILIGNGDLTESYPLTQGTVSHELAHLVTDTFSKLIYENQSGGINESFSDITEMAMKQYIQNQYPWFAYNWTIGIEETKTATPTRYMYDPPLDGHSIDNTANYTSGMDVHYSSGIFNKAFYIVGNPSPTAFENAYRDFIDANISYWIPASTFDYAACGVEQSAVDNHHSLNSYIQAFSQVGVTCKVGLQQSP